MDKIKRMDYKQAGVNIDEGNKLVQSIGSVVKETMRPGANVQLVGFGGIFD